VGLQNLTKPAAVVESNVMAMEEEASITAEEVTTEPTEPVVSNEDLTPVVEPVVAGTTTTTTTEATTIQVTVDKDAIPEVIANQEEEEKQVETSN
jgi:hypothetical protein